MKAIRSTCGWAESGARTDAASDREARKAKQRELRRLQTEMRSLEGKIAKLEERKKTLDGGLEAHYASGGDHRTGRTLA